MAKSRRLVGSALRHALIFVAISGFFIVIIEGLSSTAISFSQMLRDPTLSAPSEYDPALGWDSIPNSYVRNMYGPDKYVRTNAQGFRNEEDTAPQPPPGKLRIVCSGDSFTYGQGVANDRTWCHRLTLIDARIETVNLGQPGYGVDQIYLKYLRDGTELEHGVHIFAFVDGDFGRMGRAHQHYYGKPVLSLDNGALLTGNVPVPRVKWWINRQLERADFRTLDFASRAIRKLASGPAEETTATTELGPVVLEVFRDIVRLSAENSITPVFVLLPVAGNAGRDTPWHNWLENNMAEIDAQFIDLIPALRKIQASRLPGLFIAESDPAGGHYTERGNEWIAVALYNKLLQNPEIAARLMSIDDRAGSKRRSGQPASSTE